MEICASNRVLRYPPAPDLQLDGPLPEHVARTEAGRLSGAMEISGLSYGYQRHAPPLIEDFELSPKGERALFVARGDMDRRHQNGGVGPYVAPRLHQFGGDDEPALGDRVAGRRVNLRHNSRAVCAQDHGSPLSALPSASGLRSFWRR